jgi:hypothetical protein
MTARIPALIQETKQKIVDLADNNKRRWSQFTGDVPFSLRAFSRKLADFQITRNPDEAGAIWSAFNVRGSEMQFGEFVQFLQNANPEPAEAKSRPTSVLVQLYRSRKPFIDYCLSADRSITGVITQKQLTEFALSNDIISRSSDLFPVIGRLDPSNTGKLNYFQLMVELCEYAGSDLMDDYLSSAADSKLPPLDSKQQSQGGRAHLDPSIFTDPNAHGKATDGARHDLDPSIFGQKQERTRIFEAPPAPIDLASAKDCTDYNTEQSISLVARIANAKFRSLRDCFGHWRGPTDRLTWEDVYRGMVTDGKVELSPDVLESMVGEYGGELTVASFTRLVSDGARLNAPEPVREAPRPLTDRDVLLNKISTSLKGKPWEAVIKPSKNSLDLVRNLKKLGVNMKSDELRATFEVLGIKGICDEIKQRQAPPKKRGSKV